MQKRILVVEDDFDNRTIFTEILRYGGYAVEGAVDGVDALDHLWRFEPHLLVLDLSMPRMGGWELLHCIRREARTAEVPVCIVSAHIPTPDDTRLADFFRVARYLLKPLDPRVLLREVGAVLGREGLDTEGRQNH